MNKKYILFAAIVGSSMGLASCSDFLDEMPDQRTEVTSENADYLLVTAYPNSMPLEMFEMYSDNTDAFPNRYAAWSRLQEDLYKWEDTSQNEDDSPAAVWEGCYKAIATANQVLTMIAEQGNPSTMDATRGEALLCRAYNHFILATVFCKAYSSTAATDLGVPYMTSLERICWRDFL